VDVSVAETPKSKPEAKKTRSKASKESSLDAWPEQEEEVETFNFGKKS
jgi:hypothetical protein